jgi:catechol 2,3-dioxygenase-like lactoylglutathione lyase family enzyme
MEARIHVLTLAVDDLERALRFYRDGLGFESAGMVGSEFPGDDINPAGAIAQPASHRLTVPRFSYCCSEQ